MAVQVSTRIGDYEKQQLDEILNEIGLNISIAINIYFRAIINERKIPFELKAARYEGDPAVKKRIENVKQGKSVTVSDKMWDDMAREFE